MFSVLASLFASVTAPIVGRTKGEAEGGGRM